MFTVLRFAAPFELSTARQCFRKERIDSRGPEASRRACSMFWGLQRTLIGPGPLHDVQRARTGCARARADGEATEF
eukprot:3257345-Alexandrium_andersonii.AAC.1